VWLILGLLDETQRTGTCSTYIRCTQMPARCGPLLPLSKGKPGIPHRPGRSQGWEPDIFPDYLPSWPQAPAWGYSCGHDGAFCSLAALPPVPRLYYPIGPPLTQGT
jgi:hypothetical protein